MTHYTSTAGGPPPWGDDSGGFEAVIAEVMAAKWRFAALAQADRSDVQLIALGRSDAFEVWSAVAQAGPFGPDHAPFWIVTYETHQGDRRRVIRDDPERITHPLWPVSTMRVAWSSPTVVDKAGKSMLLIS